MIKPDAVGAGNTGAITKMIEDAGFRIVAMKKTQLSADLAGKFYEIHKERPFYGELCKLTLTPSTAQILMLTLRSKEVSSSLSLKDSDF
jgi:nucleoside-diphosphate kinase